MYIKLTKQSVREVRRTTKESTQRPRAPLRGWTIAACETACSRCGRGKRKPARETRCIVLKIPRFATAWFARLWFPPNGSYSASRRVTSRRVCELLFRVVWSRQSTKLPINAWEARSRTSLHTRRFSSSSQRPRALLFLSYPFTSTSTRAARFPTRRILSLSLSRIFHLPPSSYNIVRRLRSGVSVNNHAIRKIPLVSRIGRSSKEFIAICPRWYLNEIRIMRHANFILVVRGWNLGTSI